MIFPRFIMNLVSEGNTRGRGERCSCFNNGHRYSAPSPALFSSSFPAAVTGNSLQTVFKPFRPWKLDLLSSERVGLESALSSTIRTINFPTPPPTISLRSNKYLPSFSFTDINKSSTHSVSTREETRFQKNERNEPVTISYIPLIVTAVKNGGQSKSYVEP